MIIKIYRHKRPKAFRYLVPYVLRDVEYRNPESSFVMTHNIYEEERAIEEFEENLAYKSKRSNGVSAYHVMLAFHPDDAEQLSPEAMEDLTRKFIELRTDDNAMALAAPHLDTKSPHVHIVLSSNEIASEKSIKPLSRKAFYTMRDQLEAYQKEKYPQLNRSIVFDGKEQERLQYGKAKSNDRAVRLGKAASEKAKLQAKVMTLAQRSYSMSDLANSLEMEGINVYRQRGKIKGIEDAKRKYRFTTLGIDPEILKKLERAEERRKGFGTLDTFYRERRQ